MTLREAGESVENDERVQDMRRWRYSQLVWQESTGYEERLGKPTYEILFRHLLYRTMQEAQRVPSIVVQHMPNVQAELLDGEEMEKIG